MPFEAISAEVKRFIQTTINSVDQLELLLFLMSNASREWTGEEIAAEIRMSPESAAQKLADLVAARLLTKRAEDGVDRYRYAPESNALAAEVASSLDLAYRERRDSVLQLIYTRPLEHIRVFADAFRVRRIDGE